MQLRPLKKDEHIEKKVKSLKTSVESTLLQHLRVDVREEARWQATVRDPMSPAGDYFLASGVFFYIL